MYCYFSARNASADLLDETDTYHAPSARSFNSLLTDGVKSLDLSSLSPFKKQQALKGLAMQQLRNRFKQHAPDSLRTAYSWAKDANAEYELLKKIVTSLK